MSDFSSQAQNPFQMTGFANAQVVKTTYSKYSPNEVGTQTQAIALARVSDAEDGFKELLIRAPEGDARIYLDREAARFIAHLLLSPAAKKAAT